MRVLGNKVILILFCAWAATAMYGHFFPKDIRRQPFRPVASDSPLPYGCRNVRCIMEHDSWAAERFDPTVPLFIGAADARLFNDRASVGSEKTYLGPALKTLEYNRQLLDGFHADTCAVVGNSSNLLGAEYGEFINGHDTVIRMNNAPVEAYRNDVGNKTTFSINYAEKETLLPYQTSTINILRGLHKMKDGYFLADNDTYLDRILSEMKNIYSLTLHHPQVALWHPRFTNYVMTTWYHEHFVTNGPSSGFFAVIFALHICDRVDLFGFGANRYGAWGHYFDSQETKVKPDQHNPDYQETILAILERKKLITIYPGIPK